MGALKGIFLEARAEGSVVVMKCATLLDGHSLVPQIMGVAPAWYDTLEEHGREVSHAALKLKVGESVTFELE